MLGFDLDAAIDEVLGGDRDAFRKILHAYGLALRSYISAYIHTPEDIDDLSQDVFITAYGHLPEFRRGQDFGAWLRGIARNKIQHHFRGASRRNKAMARFREEVARTVERRLERAVSADTSGSIEVLLDCIGRLPERMRLAVRAGLDGGKAADLAGQMRTTVGAVHRLHSRANRLLRECMRKERG